mgnify:FL=1
MPIAGEILEMNSLLEDSPELVNEDPYGDGWMIKVKRTQETETDLLSPEEYKNLIGQ